MNSDKKISCQCFFKSVLAGDSVEFIKSLFKSVDRKCPKGQMLGLIGESKPQARKDCPFKYSWGFETYCDNQRYIKQYIKQHKTKIKGS